MYNYLKATTYESWAWSQSWGHRTRYNSMTSNNAEHINAILRYARDSPISHLLEDTCATT